MRDWPWLVRGTVLGGAVGALAGLIVGLTVYAPTAPFAALELGVPAAFAGTLVGGIAELAGHLTNAARRSKRRNSHPR